MPTDDDRPPITVRGYARTPRPRPVTFTCLDCGATVTEERAPGPTPRYCASCSADPIRIRERVRARKAAQRQRQQAPPPDAAAAELSRPTTTSDVTELAGSVTDEAPAVETDVKHIAIEQWHEYLIVN